MPYHMCVEILYLAHGDMCTDPCMQTCTQHTHTQRNIHMHTTHKRIHTHSHKHAVLPQNYCSIVVLLDTELLALMNMSLHCANYMLNFKFLFQVRT